MRFSFFKILIFACFFIQNAAAQELSAYLLFNEKGEQVSFQKMMQVIDKQADVVLFGELHNSPIVHWLELSVLQEWHKMAGENLKLASEIFETDDQLIIDEFWAGIIQERHFENESKLWDNYETDYKPLIDYARQHNLPFIASNVPRRYASLVARAGVGILDSLPAVAQQYFMPLPLLADTLIPNYSMLVEMGEHGEMNGNNFMYAQAIKDATMAHCIAKNLDKKTKILHINGDFHSMDKGGIYHYLKKERPKTKIIVLSSVESDTMEFEDEWKGRADFILVVPSNFPKSY